MSISPFMPISLSLWASCMFDTANQRMSISFQETELPRCQNVRSSSPLQRTLSLFFPYEPAVFFQIVFNAVKIYLSPCSLQKSILFFFPFGFIIVPLRKYLSFSIEKINQCVIMFLSWALCRQIFRRL